MAKLLNASGLVPDDRAWVSADQPTISDGPAIYPLAFWMEHRDQLATEAAVWLDVDAEPDQFAELIPELSLIAIEFPAFSDGRGMSLAVLLRTRFGFRGELRAAGAVHEDLVHYLQRCGFDSYLLPEGRDHTVAQRALTRARDTYQGSVIEPDPAFRRAARS